MKTKQNKKIVFLSRLQQTRRNKEKNTNFRNNSILDKELFVIKTIYALEYWTDPRSACNNWITNFQLDEIKPMNDTC